MSSTVPAASDRATSTLSVVPLGWVTSPATASSALLMVLSVPPTSATTKSSGTAIAGLGSEISALATDGSFGADGAATSDAGMRFASATSVVAGSAAAGLSPCGLFLPRRCRGRLYLSRCRGLRLRRRSGRYLRDDGRGGCLRGGFRRGLCGGLGGRRLRRGVSPRGPSACGVGFAQADRLGELGRYVVDEVRRDLAAGRLVLPAAVGEARQHQDEENEPELRFGAGIAGRGEGEPRLPRIETLLALERVNDFVGVEAEKAPNSCAETRWCRWCPESGRSALLPAPRGSAPECAAHGRHRTSCSRP